jgi:hypothetical protein
MRPLVIALVATVLVGCPLTAKSPEDYRKEVNACVDNSTTAEQYEACCIDAARRYGADPSDCLLPPAPADGGAE